MFPVLLYVFVSICRTYQISCFLHAWKERRKNLQHNPKDRSWGFFLSNSLCTCFYSPCVLKDLISVTQKHCHGRPGTTNSSNKSLVLFCFVLICYSLVIVYYGVLITSWLKCLSSHSLISRLERFSSRSSVQIKQH